MTKFLVSVNVPPFDKAALMSPVFNCRDVCACAVVLRRMPSRIGVRVFNWLIP